MLKKRLTYYDFFFGIFYSEISIFFKKAQVIIYLTSKSFMYTRVKSSGTIFFNYHETFPSMNHEKTAIFRDISMNFHENIYREIKTPFPVYVSKKI